MFLDGKRTAAEDRGLHYQFSHSYWLLSGRWALGFLLVLGHSHPAAADCEVGKRIFVAELILEDPCNDDELLLAQPSVFPVGKDPSETEFDISYQLSKRITPNFGVEITNDWTNIHGPLGTKAGFGNLGTNFRYEFFSDAKTETVLSTGLVVEWGGTGAKSVGAQPFTTLRPTLYAGKGLNGLPDSMRFLRPLGITGSVAYSLPSESSTSELDGGILTKTPNPQFFDWGITVEYSMTYLKSMVVDLGLPEFFNHLVPLTEFSFETQVNNFNDEPRTTGVIGSGIAYHSKNLQFTVEARIPVNSSDGLGVIAALHLHTETLFPNTLGRPIFGASKVTDED
jgi:hypothetical protein